MTLLLKLVSYALMQNYLDLIIDYMATYISGCIGLNHLDRMIVADSQLAGSHLRVGKEGFDWGNKAKVDWGFFLLLVPPESSAAVADQHSVLERLGPV